MRFEHVCVAGSSTPTSWHGLHGLRGTATRPFPTGSVEKAPLLTHCYEGMFTESSPFPVLGRGEWRQNDRGQSG